MNTRKPKLVRLVSGLTAVLCSAAAIPFVPGMTQTAAAEVVYDGFEQNYDGWHGSDTSVTVTALTETGYAGSRGMVVTDRTSAAQGAASSKGLYLFGGVSYTYRVEVMSETDENFHLTLRTIDEKTGEETIRELSSKQVKADTWTALSATYTAPADSYEFELTITTDSTADFRFDEVQITTMTDPMQASAAQSDLGLKDEFAGYFRVGNILNGGTIQNSGITGNILKDCNAIECENETKPDATLVQNGSTNTNIKVSLNSCAAIADFAVKNNLGFRGHTMVWHSQTPSWFFKDNFQNGGNWVSKDVMDQRMESYIQNMFAAFQAQYPSLDLYAYDICNECVSDDSNRTANFGGAREAGDSKIDGQGGKSAWVQVYGDNSFVEKAFTYARKYAPKGCDLYYNDYNEDWDHKRDCIYNMCKSLYQKGLLDGVGMQSHVPANATGFAGTDSYIEAMEKYLSIGCDVQITELDISLLENGSPKYSYTDQANKYAAIFQAAMDWNTNPKSDGRVTLVQIWGPNDANSWLSAGSNALLYDANNQPKQAYTAVTSLIPKDQWGKGIVEPEPVEPDENGYYFHDTFEGSTDGWTGRGAASVETSGRTYYAGAESLLTSGRTASWNGASKALSSNPFKPGETFSFSAIVNYFDGADTTEFKLTVQYTGSDGEAHFDEVASATGAKGQWVQLANPFYKIPEDASNVLLYVETSDETTENFYVDEVIGAVAGVAIAGPEKPVIRTKFVLGDVTGNEIVDIFDLAAAKHGLIKGFAKKADEKAADVDQNGVVEVTDIVLLQKFLVKEITQFPVAEKIVSEPDFSEWDNYTETATPQMQQFYADSIYQMGNTSRLRAKIAQAMAGEPTRVSYIGGSITEGGRTDTCYVSRSAKYFADTFGTGSNVSFTNAGMSGTSSVVGLMRAENDILREKPDVIFIEFSVNDHPGESYEKGFEGLVRKCLMQENEPAVIILITRSKGGYSSQEQMVKVGKNYNVPIISMDNALTKAFNSGLLQPSDYFTDEYHPHADGAKLISDCIGYYYRQALKSKNASDAYTMPSSTAYGSEYTTATIVPLTDLTNFNAGSFTQSSKGYGTLPYALAFQKNSANSPITFSTQGRGLFLVYCANSKDMGTAVITVNGKTSSISGVKQYTWGGPDTDLAYIQDTSGKLDVSIKMENAGSDFTIWGIGIIK
ncbi:MAG: endo-1,4-beta-xylanase [Oscillospiraceae bacterium]|nr:endo-1,4-beta-xylanase [Oscillospiraceae bacterium]